MATENWLALAAVLVPCFGGLYWLISANFKAFVRNEINALKQSLKDEQVQDLKNEIASLREHASKTK